MLVLALVIEARVALRRRTKKQRKADARLPRWLRRFDIIAATCYAVAYVGATALLVLAFVVALSYLAGAPFESEPASRSTVYFIVLVGVILTAFLPVCRVAVKYAGERLRHEHGPSTPAAS